MGQLEWVQLEYGFSSASPIRPQGNGLRRPYTKVAENPDRAREKPFLQVDAVGSMSVCIPSLRNRSVGITWHQGNDTRKNPYPSAVFYIAHSEVDTAATFERRTGQR